MNSHQISSALTIGSVSALAALPLTVAFAETSGVSMQAMFMTAILGPILGAWMSPYRHAVFGPNAGVSAALAGVGAFAVPQTPEYMGYVWAVCLMVSFWLFAFAGVFRLMERRHVAATDLILAPVTRGLLFSLGCMFVLQSLYLCLGYSPPRLPQQPLASFWGNIALLIDGQRYPIPMLTSGVTLIVGMLALSLHANAPWLRPKMPNWCRPIIDWSGRLAVLIAVVAGTLIGNWLYAKHGYSSNLEFVGEVRMVWGVSIPLYSLEYLGILLQLMFGVALTIAVLVVIQDLTTTAAYRDLHDKDSPSDGVSAHAVTHVLLGFFGGTPEATSAAKSSLEYQLGGNRISLIVSGVVTLVFVTLAHSLVARIPLPALGGGLLLVGWMMMSPAANAAYFRHGLNERVGYIALLYGVTCAAALVVGGAPGVILFLMQTGLLIVYVAKRLHALHMPVIFMSTVAGTFLLDNTLGVSGLVWGVVLGSFIGYGLHYLDSTRFSFTWLDERVCLEGLLIPQSFPQIERRLRLIPEGQSQLVLDFRAVTFLLGGLPISDGWFREASRRADRVSLHFSHEGREDAQLLLERSGLNAGVDLVFS